MRKLILLLVLTVASLLPAQEKPAGFARWEPEIAGIEARLQAAPPALGGVVFAGSSSIRMWDLKSSFPELALTNCGFGGSCIADSTYFAPRLLLPLKPRLIVFYAGDNDSASGLPAARIAEDFKTFAVVIHTALPECRILYIPIKPSIARKALRPVQAEANHLIALHCGTRSGCLQYVDLATPLLDKEGALRPELYQNDGLHLSAAGYAIWSDLLRPLLNQTQS